MGTAVPLFTSSIPNYAIRTGGTFLDFNIDPDFNNCIDRLVINDLSMLKTNENITWRRQFWYKKNGPLCYGR